MSEEVIKILEYICEKIGIAIDFTQQDIMPQIMEVYNSYITYGIVKNLVSMVVCILIVICAILVITKYMPKQEKICKVTQTDVWGYEWCAYSKRTQLNLMGILVVGTAFFIAFVNLLIFYINFHSLIQWLFIPEVKMIETVKLIISEG